MDVFNAVIGFTVLVSILLVTYHAGASKAIMAISSPFFMVTDEGQIIFINPLLKDDALLGISSKDISTLPPQFILFIQKQTGLNSFVYEHEFNHLKHSYTFIGKRMWFKGQRCWQVVVNLNLVDESNRNRLLGNKALLHNIIQNIPDAIGMMDENLVYEACNPAFVKALGIESPEDLLGRKLDQVAPKNIAEKFAYSDRNVLETGREFHIIDEITDEKGDKQWMEARKFAYTDQITNSKGLFIIARDITESELAKEKLKQAKNEFRRLSLIDGLTGVGNRRYFDENLEGLWQLHIEKQQPLTIMFCDIDEFKKLNDIYGHSEGDKALILVASALERSVSDTEDRVFRIGGEEFAFILSDTDNDKADVIARRIHKQIEALQFRHDGSLIKSTLTISIGVVTIIPQIKHSVVDILEEVDKALYQAKSNGKDQTVYAA